MSHTHYCDATGHLWECDGTAVRRNTGDVMPSPCVCICGVSMELGDHSQCPIELLTCPAHAAGQRGDQHGGALSGVNVFADALQAMLEDAGFEGGGGRRREVGMSRDQHEPSLGIVWLVRGKLLFNSVPLSEAEAYDTHLNHPRSHIDVWAQLQKLGAAPRESEYEEYPRGRVTYHPAFKEFTILADRCILDRKDLIDQIKDELHLPNKVKLGADAHYRCYRCLYGRDDSDDE